MKSLCVFTGSSHGVRAEYAETARDLGRTLAERGISLVYGGGRVGLMGVIADAVLTSGGNVIGVIPEALMAKEVGHGAVSELRVVKTMHERKALMADLSEGFVAMPGGWGTLDEFFEILTWAQLGLHRKPCGMLNVASYFDPLLAFLDYAVAEGFVRPQHRAMICVSGKPPDLLDLLADHKPPVVEKWIDRAEA
jgi:uncharacterized protein (TIGR00730 family)